MQGNRLIRANHAACNCLDSRRTLKEGFEFLSSCHEVAGLANSRKNPTQCLWTLSLTEFSSPLLTWSKELRNFQNTTSEQPGPKFDESPIVYVLWMPSNWAAPIEQLSYHSIVLLLSCSLWKSTLLSILSWPHSHDDDSVIMVLQFIFDVGARWGRKRRPGGGDCRRSRARTRVVWSKKV